jgi:hypothetical protein
MAMLRPDEAIRTIVAELAALHPEDQRAILGALGETERQTVELFLREYGKLFDTAFINSPADYDPARLSDWMQQLLQRNAEKRGSMSPLALETLLKCVAAIHPVMRPQP